MVKHTYGHCHGGFPHGSRPTDPIAIFFNEDGTYVSIKESELTEEQRLKGGYLRKGLGGTQWVPEMIHGFYNASAPKNSPIDYEAPPSFSERSQAVIMCHNKEAGEFGPMKIELNGTRLKR